MDGKNRSFLVCPLSDSLIQDTKLSLESIKKNPGDKKLRHHTIEVVRNLTEASLNYYFIRPLYLLEINKIGSRFVGMGVAAGLKLINTFGKKLVNNLTDKQMILLAEFIDESLIELAPELCEFVPAAEEISH